MQLRKTRRRNRWLPIRQPRRCSRQRRQIEDQAQTTAPGTADMVAAEARTAELASLAMQHKLISLPAT